MTQVGQVRRQRRRVHRHQGIDLSPGVIDVVAGEVDLKTADAGQRAARARISAGKSGNVAMSLPTRADVLVNCVPANCMPSPESPQKRTVASSSSIRGLAECAAGVASVVVLMV